MKKKSQFLLLLFFSFGYFTLNAQDWAVAAKVSTLGGNIELYHSFGTQFNAHVGINYFGLKQDIEESDYSAEATVGLMAISALGDYFPFESSSFKITAGLYLNLNDIDAVITPVDQNVGGDVYTSEDLGTIDVNIKFNPIAPYIGLGFGNPTSGTSGFGFSFDIGTMYQGGSIVELSAGGLLEPTASEEQEKLIEDNLSWFKWYPVVSLGITYNF